MKVVIKCGEQEHLVQRDRLKRSHYFESLLSGQFALAYQGGHPLLTLAPEWEGPLPSYIYFLKHGQSRSRITGLDYALASYLNDTGYLELCNSSPKISNKLYKRLRHNQKLKRLHPKLDQKSMDQRLYFSELTDSEFELIVENWPRGVSHTDVAQEWVYRKGTILGLPDMFKPAPDPGTLLTLPVTSLWAYWLLKSLHQWEQTLRQKDRYTNVYFKVGQFIERQTKKLPVIPMSPSLVTLTTAEVDDSWSLQAIQYLKAKFQNYRRAVKIENSSILRSEGQAISVLVERLNKR